MIEKITLCLFMACISAAQVLGQASGFPDQWIGLWHGDLEIHAGPKKVNTIPMSLEIQPLEESGSFNYYITYGNEEDALRPYLLKTIDAEKGHYVLDENNGIQIEMYLVADRLISAFEVQKSFIQTTSYLEGDQLIYEIYAGSMTPASVTGDTIVGADTIPPVSTFPINVLQRAVLSKRK